MRDVVTIGASNTFGAVKDKLSQELGSLKDEGFTVFLEEKDCGGIKYIGCNLDDDDGNLNSRAVFRYYIAKVLSEVIANDLPLTEIPRIIRSNYSHFTEVEKNEIISRAIDLYKSDWLQGNLYRVVKRKNQIITSLLEYLNLNDEVVLEGFLRFRLKEFCEELSAYVDKAVDSYMIDREYEEFVSLLRYFVEIQEPKMGEAHIVVRSNGLFRILDSHKEVVITEYLEGFVVDLVQNQVEYEDLLLSALITLVPTKVIVHLDPKSKVAKTISQVFAGRSEACPYWGGSCPLCNYAQVGTGKE
ncbi:MAG: putative sporulation protein YtxC [Firmicutes bacterium]|nr:putative sporulation protein YtxC [Bacillota bacterium]